MISAKYRRVGYVALAAFGAIYLNLFTGLETPFPFLKVYAAILPVQIGALIYVLWLIQHRQQAASKSKDRV